MSRLLLRERYVVHDPDALPDGGMIEDGGIVAGKHRNEVYEIVRQ